MQRVEEVYLGTDLPKEAKKERWGYLFEDLCCKKNKASAILSDLFFFDSHLIDATQVQQGCLIKME